MRGLPRGSGACKKRIEMISLIYRAKFLLLSPPASLFYQLCWIWRQQFHVIPVQAPAAGDRSRRSPRCSASRVSWSWPHTASKEMDQLVWVFLSLWHLTLTLSFISPCLKWNPRTRNSKPRRDISRPSRLTTILSYCLRCCFCAGSPLISQLRWQAGLDGDEVQLTRTVSPIW